MNISWIKNNIWIKVGALVLAIILWFYVAGEERIETKLTIPIEFQLSENMVVYEQEMSFIEVIVNGRKDLISKVENVSSSFDLRDYKEPQTVTFQIQREDIPIAPEIKVIQMFPSRLMVKIDKLTEKKLPIKAIITGESAYGFSVDGTLLDPVSSIVIGPEQLLSDMKYIETEPVDITGRRKSFRKMVRLKMIPLKGHQVPPQFVEVIIKIKSGRKN